MNDFFDDLQRREERTRTETINGKEYTVQCTDPYGLWHIVNCEQPELDGTYTTVEAVWQAIHTYEKANALKEQLKADKNVTKRVATKSVNLLEA